MTFNLADHPTPLILLRLNNLTLDGLFEAVGDVDGSGSGFAHSEIRLAHSSQAGGFYPCVVIEQSYFNTALGHLASGESFHPDHLRIGARGQEVLLIQTEQPSYGYDSFGPLHKLGTTAEVIGPTRDLDNLIDGDGYTILCEGIAYRTPYEEA